MRIGTRYTILRWRNVYDGYYSFLVRVAVLSKHLNINLKTNYYSLLIDFSVNIFVFIIK